MGSGTRASRVLSVVAGENFWGSIAAQLGGVHTVVTSIVTAPNADPHEYESSADGARAFASADYVILNGAGYDSWGDKLLAANPRRGRTALVVADLLGRRTGDNPHFWYQPQWVERVADRIAADYQVLDPADAPYFAGRRAALRSAFAPYHRAIAAIRAGFAGTKVGSTESIFVYLAQALGLDLVSPPEFMNAVAEGNDPPAASVVQFEQQLSARDISVLVYNAQTATAVTTNLRTRAQRQGIPSVPITETIEPPSATFQDWQTQQLQALSSALSSSGPARG